LLLSIKAELENVTDLQPAANDYEYFFEVNTTGMHSISAADTVLLPFLR